MSVPASWENSSRLVDACVRTRGAEGHTGDECGHEPVRAGEQRRRSRRRGPGPARPSGRKAGLAPVVLAGLEQEQRANQPDPDADAGTTEEVAVPPWRPEEAPWHRFGGRRSGEEQVDERRGDAVVQAALDVEHAAHPGGHPFVFHYGRPERGVGRGHDGADGGGHPEPGAGEQPGGEGAAPAPMVSGNPMPRRRTGCARSARSRWTLTRDASAKRTRASVTSAKERMADECRSRVDEGGQDRGSTTRPRTTKRNRCRHVPALEASRDEAPQDHAGRDDGHGGEVEVVCHRSRRRTSERHQVGAVSNARQPIEVDGAVAAERLPLSGSPLMRRPRHHRAMASPKAEGSTCDRHR